MSALSLVFVLCVVVGLGIVGLFAWLSCGERKGNSRRGAIVLAVSLLAIFGVPFGLLIYSFGAPEFNAALQAAGPVAILSTIGAGIVVGLLLEFVLRKPLKAFLETLTDAELVAYHLDLAIRSQRVEARKGSVVDHLLDARRVLERLSRSARRRHELLVSCYQQMLEVVSKGIDNNLWVNDLEFGQIRIADVGVGFVLCEEVGQFTPKFEVNSDLLPPEVRRRPGEMLWRLRQATQIPCESGGRGPGYEWLLVSVGYLPLIPQQRRDRAPASSSGDSVAAAA